MRNDEHCIFHVDVNSAFLSWSALKKLEEDPESTDLRTIPSAVGGDTATRHGVITAKSIPAKRYGVQTGEPVVQALRKCPSLVLVRADFKVYRSYSRALMEILREYTDLVEQASIDEAYLDMSGSPYRLAGSRTGLKAEEQWPLNAAHEIRKRVYRELGFTVNIGVSVNKLLAKMASDFEKPDKVHTLYPDEVPRKMWPLPMRELHGCGGATEERLRQLGICTIGQAAAMDPAILQSNLGQKAGDYIWKSANGIGSSVVRPQHEKAKSYSNEETTPEDISSENYRTKGIEIVQRLGRKVASRMEKDHVMAKTIQVIVKTDDFRRHSRQATIGSATADPAVICREAEALMDQMLFSADGIFKSGRTLRLIGVGCSGLTDGAYQQMDLLSWMKEAPVRDEKQRKKKKLEEMMRQASSRFGADAIRRGTGGSFESGADSQKR